MTDHYGQTEDRRTLIAMNDTYERLRDRLEMMATGYPATANGVEIKILRNLFSEEDADLFLKMEARPETAHQMAVRIGADVADMAARLEGMARKGLIFRVKQDEAICYFPVPFIVGIYEFQLNNLSKPLLKDIMIIIWKSITHSTTGISLTTQGQTLAQAISEEETEDANNG